MNILPIGFLTSYDKCTFGEDWINLAHLQRMGLPVALGYVISPPAELIKKIKSNEKFGSLKSLRDRFINSEESKNLFKSFKEKRITEKIWSDLLNKWFKCIDEEIERNGKLNLNSLPLKPETIFFTGNIKSEGLAYISELKKLVEIKVERGELDIPKLMELDELIREANSKILLSYLYDWILDDEGFKLIRLRPFTQDFMGGGNNTPSDKSKLEVRSERFDVGGENNAKTALKIYGNEEIDLGEWTEIGTPEEVLKLTKSEGKSFVINLDKINQLLTGSKEVSVDPALIKNFIEEPLKGIIKNGGLVLVGGSLILQDDILKLLIKLGVYGVIVSGDKGGLEEHIRSLEQMHVNRLLN